MLVIQHIWTKWTKRSRGANSPLKRPLLDEAWPLPELPGGGIVHGVIRHEIRALEDEDFSIIEEFGPTDREQWSILQPRRNNPLDWRVHDKQADIMLKKPSEYQQTKWPAFLPKPLFVLNEGETARIDWNGRFSFGSNRSSYYEQHRYWLAVTSKAHPRLFLDALPKKRIDLTTGIY